MWSKASPTASAGTGSQVFRTLLPTPARCFCAIRHPARCTQRRRQQSCTRAIQARWLAELLALSPLLDVQLLRLYQMRICSRPVLVLTVTELVPCMLSRCLAPETRRSRKQTRSPARSPPSSWTA